MPVTLVTLAAMGTYEPRSRDAAERWGENLVNPDADISYVYTVPDTQVSKTLQFLDELKCLEWAEIEDQSVQLSDLYIYIMTVSLESLLTSFAKINH